MFSAAPSGLRRLGQEQEPDLVDGLDAHAWSPAAVGRTKEGLANYHENAQECTGTGTVYRCSHT